MRLAETIGFPFLWISAVAAPSEDGDQLELMIFMFFEVEARQAYNRVLLGDAVMAFVGSIALPQNASTQSALSLWHFFREVESLHQHLKVLFGRFDILDEDSHFFKQAEAERVVCLEGQLDAAEEFGDFGVNGILHEFDAFEVH